MYTTYILSTLLLLYYYHSNKRENQIHNILTYVNAASTECVSRRQRRPYYRFDGWFEAIRLNYREKCLEK